MSWVTVIWAMAAGACVTLAAVHFLVWCWDRSLRANLWFAGTALSIAPVALTEWSLMHARTPAEYLALHRWGHVATFVTVVGIVGFVRAYFRTERRWLARTVLAMRTLVVVLAFIPGPTFNFREVTALLPFELFGETVVVPRGVPTPWAHLGESSLLLMAGFVVDAAIRFWRSGGSRERRHALVVGGSVALFLLTCLMNAVVVHAGIMRVPYFITFSFLLIVVAMGFGLSRDLLQAANLSRDLREGEQRLELAAEAAGLGLWVWEIPQDEIWITGPGRALFGFAAGERVDFARFAATLHPEDRERVRTVVQRALEERGSYETEYRVMLADGSTRWIAARAQVECGEDGKPLSVRGVSIDVTGRKRSEEALRESEARFRTVADTAPVMIWMSGRDKLWNFFNKGWLDFTGRKPEQELGNGWAKGVHPDDFARCLDTYTSRFDAREAFTMQYRLRKKDGEFGWVLHSGVPRFAADGAFLGFIGSAIDITNQKLAEERVRLVVEASPNGVVLANVQGRIVLVNGRVEKMFGYARGELIGAGVESLVPERLRSAHAGHRAGFHAAPTARAMGLGRELFARRKDGSEFPVEIGISPVDSPEGVLVLSVIVDITARRQTETEMRELRNELTHVMRVTTLSELSGSLAHELNQPLAIILSNAQAAQRFLSQSPPNLTEVSDILVDIIAEDQRAGEVIKRLRTLLRRGEIATEPVELNEAVNEVLDLAHADLVGRGVAVVRGLAGELPEVRGDRVQLQQVVLNLILNGADAMSGNAPDARRLHVVTARCDAGVRVSVRDEGEGLAADAEKIFAPFFTTKPHGLGMGLAICRSIIGAHGGRLWAEPHMERGAVFQFELPAIDRKAE